MALMINEDCLNCGACLPGCPNEAISEGDEFCEIDPELCTECQGAFDESQCASVCPVDACFADPDHEEESDTLQARYDEIHGS